MLLRDGELSELSLRGFGMEPLLKYLLGIITSKSRLVMTTVRLSFLLFLVCGTVLLVPGARAFNIDIPSVITHRGPSGSMFGFSVAQHRDSNVSWFVPYFLHISTTLYLYLETHFSLNLCIPAGEREKGKNRKSLVHRTSLVCDPAGIVGRISLVRLD